ncbi:hypothetical protein GCM10017600_06440 [Streptosporangium carneum]|uniref:Uncharacterized protein n=1 Tax=Streptosporangium carneum TaxID=47481 RepID=A0A9W6MAF1_9ACTN|nr:hypothetical protein GCM10017600_06440 [Streptosporangium carneum]
MTPSQGYADRRPDEAAYGTPDIPGEGGYDERCPGYQPDCVFVCDARIRLTGAARRPPRAVRRPREALPGAGETSESGVVGKRSRPPRSSSQKRKYQ